ncbi:hypothetical protein E4U61_006665 [Claviceps capensis]|nr:hypothetical protein E4U61_006665 [Claviceps capensis]
MTSLARVISIAALVSPEKKTTRSSSQPEDEPGTRIIRPWLIHEDYLLMCMVRDIGAREWVRISAVVGSRSAKQCRERWHHRLNPRLIHDPITREEGDFILGWVARKGQQWAAISRRLEGRSDNAVKNWYYAMKSRIRRRERASQRKRRSSR